MEIKGFQKVFKFVLGSSINAPQSIEKMVKDIDEKLTSWIILRFIMAVETHNS